MDAAASPPWPFGHLKMFGYDFVMVDPPTEFHTRSARGQGKSPGSHYKTMTLREIADLPLGQLLRAGGVAWVWETWPLHATGDMASIINGTWIDPDDVRSGRPFVMRGWSLRGKTGGVWVKRTKHGKLRWGTGYIHRSVCEPYIIATIGDDHGFGDTRLLNMLDGLAREHSRKPEEVYRLVDRLLPRSAWRADVFSRQSRKNWDSWGLEAGKFDAEV